MQMNTAFDLCVLLYRAASELNGLKKTKNCFVETRMETHGWTRDKQDKKQFLKQYIYNPLTFKESTKHIIK